jgi:hypothetical protein
VKRTLEKRLGGEKSFQAFDVHLIRTDKGDPGANEEAQAFLRVTVKDPDAKKVGRAFSNVVIEMVLASYPGFYTTSPPTPESPYGVYWPALVPAEEVEEVVVAPDGTRIPVPHPKAAPLAATIQAPAIGRAPVPRGDTKRVPLGTAFGARSGDKGGNANVGVWARSDAGYAWLESFLTVERFKSLIPESRSLEVRRYAFPNIRSLNFVVVGLLGEGVSSNSRTDPQAKSLGEYLRAKVVEMPVELLADAPRV